ncbi:unnamed protein product [Sphagnum troendelagicum]|jgi:sterol-4alpha-carboxylate 3-dehydrogenase (decarboxylating)
MESLTCVVTGGRGFVGRNLVLKLLQEDKFSIKVADRALEMELSPEEEETGTLDKALVSGKAQYVSVDIGSKSELVNIFRDVAVVFHTADLDSYCIDSFQLHYDATVTGTRNVIEACWECGVQKLIFLSSANIVFDGLHHIVNGDESLPIPDKHGDFASDVKAQAEALVLSANGKQGLLTCALRPSNVFGPGGDRLGEIPAFAATARAGKLRIVVGDGENIVDWTYVENVAHALLCAERALVRSDDVASGKAYFITNLEPVKFWEFVSNLVMKLGYPKPKFHLPIAMVMPVALAIESLMKLLLSPPPPLLGAAKLLPLSNCTPFQIRLLTTTRTYNCSRAIIVLGYKPVVSLEEGIRRTVESYRRHHLRADAALEPTTASCCNAQREQQHSKQHSKTHAFLGGNRMADLLLWRNKKRSFRTFIALLFTFSFYFASGCMPIPLVTRLLFWSLLTAFVYSRFLLDPLWGIALPRIPSTFSLELSEEATQEIAHTFTSVWNSVSLGLTTLAQGKDFTFFGRVLLVLRFLGLFGRYSFESFSFICLYGAFSLPFLYEQHEEEFEQFWALTAEAIDSYWGLLVTNLPASIQDWWKQKL